VNFTFLLSAIAESLLSEFIERRNIDRRWTVARNEFNRTQAAPYREPRHGRSVRGDVWQPLMTGVTSRMASLFTASGAPEELLAAP
jgi:hypothetical protein